MKFNSKAFFHGWPLILFYSIISNAQNRPIQFQHLTVENGLSNNFVWDFEQDKYGFMWIATADGLNRYDGYSIRTYRHRPYDDASLPGNQVRCLFTDSKGILWAGTESGLAHYNYNSNSFTVYRKEENNSNSLSDNRIVRICEDESGNIWVATESGLCRLDENRKQFVRFMKNNSGNSLAGNSIMDMESDVQGNLWLSSAYGLTFLDVTSLKFATYTHDTFDPNSLSTDNLRYMTIDRLGMIWISTRSHTVECFDPATKSVIRRLTFSSSEFGYANPYINELLTDKSGTVWLATGTFGIGYWSPLSDTFNFYRNRPLTESGLSSNSVRRLYQDHSGMIWVGTTTAGADRFHPALRKFDLYQPQMVGSELQLLNGVLYVFEDRRNNWWVGTTGGLEKMNMASGNRNIFRYGKNSAAALPDNVVNTIADDSAGRIWVGTANGLCRYDPIKNSFIVYRNSEKTRILPSDFIYHILKTRNGVLWVSTLSGLCRYDYDRDAFTSFDGDSSLKLLNGNIRLAFEDSGGNLWLGTAFRNGTVIRYQPSTGEIASWKFGLDDSTAVPGKNITSITEDCDGIIWIGTSSGICYFDSKKNAMHTFNPGSDAFNGKISGLLTDKRNNLWMSTAHGICRLDSSRRNFIHFDESDGLQGRHFNEFPATIMSNGSFCFCGPNGFNVFHPDSFQLNQFSPPVRLTSFSIFDETNLADSIFFTSKKISLRHNQNFFSFEFAALNYDHPEKNQFACQLIGFDPIMRQLGTSRKASYTNVPPGKYILKVLVSNNDGFWNETPLEMSISIRPAFWQTMIFKAILVAFIAALLYLGYRYRLRQIFRLQQVRNKIARDLHDDIGSSLSSIRMYSEVVRNQLSESLPQSASVLEKISHNSREVLENMNDIVWAINPLRDSLAEVVRRMQSFAAEITAPKNIEMHFDWNEKSDIKIPMEYRKNIYLIFKEAVNNSVKYSGCSELKVRVHATHSRFELRVSDNGKGFSETVGQQGNGMLNMKKRAEEMKADLFVNSETGIGSTVKLELVLPN